MVTEVADDTCAYSPGSTSLNDNRVKVCFDWLPSQWRVGILDGYSTLT